MEMGVVDLHRVKVLNMNVQLLAAAADMPTTVENAAVELVKTGVLGAVLVIIGAYAFWVTRQWNQAQKDRVADQQEVTKTLIKFSADMQTVLQALKGAIDALKVAADNGHDAVKKVSDTVDALKTATDAVKTSTEAVKASTDVIKLTVDTLKDDTRRAHEIMQRGVDDLPRRIMPR